MKTDTFSCFLLSVLVTTASASASDLTVKVATGNGFEELTFQQVTEPLAARPESRTTGIRLSAAGGDKVCEDKTLGELRGWPETKVEMELSCVNIPLVGRACTNLPRAYARNCSKRVIAQICYPSGSAVANTARNCALAGAGAAVAACIAGGCGGAAPAFVAAAKACVAASAPNLANDVSFGLTDRDDCDGWHPI